MTTVDAVVAAEAVLGRHLTTNEVARVQTIVSKGLAQSETWTRIFAILDVTPEEAARRALSLESVAAANARDHDTVLKTLYDNHVSRTEAVLGRNLTLDEKDRMAIVTAKGLSSRDEWQQIFETLGVTPEAVARRALTLQIKAGAVDGDYERLVDALRDDVETRVKRAGWA